MTSIAENPAALDASQDAAAGRQSGRSTSNLRVSRFEPLPAPQEVIAELPLGPKAAAVVDADATRSGQSWTAWTTACW